MVLVMDTFGLQFYMPLVVAMPMKSLKVRERLCSSQAERPNMIDFNQIPIFEVQSTVSASPFVVFQQFSQRAMRHRVISEPLYPVDKISIIWTCRPPNFDMTLDGCAIVSPERHLFGSKCPPFALVE